MKRLFSILTIFLLLVLTGCTDNSASDNEVYETAKISKLDHVETDASARDRLTGTSGEAQ